MDCKALFVPVPKVRDREFPHRRLVTQILLKMRLTAIMLFAGFLHVSAKTYSQKITLQEKDAPLQKVFRDIEKQSGYQFFFADNDLRQTKTVTLSVKDFDLNEVLTLTFKDQPLTYSISEKTIMVKLKEKESEKKIDNGPPPIDVHGRITNEKGEPMEGVNVIIKGAKSGTTTDADGAFTLRNVDGNSTVIISFVGYEQQIIKVAGKTALVIKLNQAVQSLKDVTVSKGYYDVKQEYNTGSVVKVEGKDIQKQPVSDPILALEGRVAGLEITQTSGLPGTYSTVRIRGQNTITIGKPVTATDPLYIIDGVPFSSQTLTSPFIGGGIINRPAPVVGKVDGIGQGLSPFNSINPSDIESIEVLKDADATAIYGSRGANGVILITTKKGKSGKLKADINLNAGFSKATHFLDLLNTEQYISMRLEAFRNDGRLKSNLVPQYANYYPDLLIWDTTRYTDWQKVIIGNKASFANGNISLSGGNENTSFVAGLGYTSQGTTVPGDYKDRRVSLHLNLINTSANKRFLSQISVLYSNDNSNLPTETDLIQNILLPPDAPPIYDANGNLNWATYHGSPTWRNPLAYSNKNAIAITDLYIANLGLSYQLLQGLTLRANLGYTVNQMDQTILWPGSALAPPLNNNADFRQSFFSTSNNKSWIVEPQINYSKEAGKSHFDLLFGTTFQSVSSDSRALAARGFSSDILISNIQAASDVSVVGSTEALYHYNAFYGRAGYTLQDRYLINLAGRRDGSSRFGPGKQFGNFGAIGIGWIFSKDTWFSQNLPMVSFGKLRASYGIAGNDNIGDYQYLSTYSPISGSGSYQGSGGLRPTLLANSDFRWEEIKKIEAAVELGFLKDRINLSASLYRNRTDNQLIPASPLPNITGFGGVTANLPALIQNQGIEIALSATAIKSRSFTWKTTGNISFHRNKLLNFPGIENTGYRYSYFVGYPLGATQVYHYTGVDPQTGVYMFASKNGTGAPLSPDDLIIDKSLAGPLYSGGLENSLSYKGLQLEFFLQFVKQNGQDYVNLSPYPGTNSNQTTYVLNRWQHPGDLTNVQKFTRGTFTQPFYDFQLSDGTFTDASYVRLKYLSLSYNLSQNVVRKIHFSNFMIFLRGQNLLTFTKYKGLDPETQGLSMPPMRTITAGIQASL